MAEHLPLSVRVPIESDNPVSVAKKIFASSADNAVRSARMKSVFMVHIPSSKPKERQSGIHCGQCANVCPTASITEVYEYPDVKAAIADPDKIVIVSTSPLCARCSR